MGLVRDYLTLPYGARQSAGITEAVKEAGLNRVVAELADLEFLLTTDT